MAQIIGLVTVKEIGIIKAKMDSWLETTGKR